jgi:hypothetical protein
MGDTWEAEVAVDDEDREEELEAAEDMEKERVFSARYPRPCIGLPDTHGGGVSFPPMILSV